jgi:hypothetical protein
MSPAPPAKSRLSYIDWMRGLACVLMFQTHCYDSWLGGEARQTKFFMYSQLGGTFPAPLFLFLAGISFALVTEKLRQKNLPPTQIARTTILRGAEVFGFGLLFRVQEYAISWGWAPKSDLLRVDVLNTIGVSMMLMGVMCWITSVLFYGAKKTGARKTGAKKTEGAPSLPRSLRQEPALSEHLEPKGWDAIPQAPFVFTATATAITISLLTPLLWTTWSPRFLPWPIESYINGMHNLGAPQPWLFPIFPWTAFAFAGLAVGFLLQTAAAKAREATMFLSLGGVGIVLVELSRWLDSLPFQLYPTYDYWHTSPEFFLIRLGMLMMIMTASYAWCRWGPATWGFSPLIQLGQASLLVYWVHIEFVYGKYSILPKRAVGIGTASVGLLSITLAMLALAYVRTHTKGWMKGRGLELLTWQRSRPANAS